MSTFGKNLEYLIPEPDSSSPMAIRWGTVLSNRTVLLDHEENPLPAETPSLIFLVPGQRVMVDSVGQTRRIVGALGRGRLLTAEDNLNTLTQTGTYWVISSGDTSTGRNYPVALAGTLKVTQFDASYAEQEYQTWTDSNGWSRRFARHYYAGAWREWSEIPQFGSWTFLTKVNSWTDVTGRRAVRYRREGDTVRLAGATVGGTSGLIGTLPTAFRPDVYVDLAATKPSSSDHTRITVQTNGQVISNQLTGASGTWISLDGLTYPLF